MGHLGLKAELKTVFINPYIVVIIIFVNRNNNNRNGNWPLSFLWLLKETFHLSQVVLILQTSPRLCLVYTIIFSKGCCLDSFLKRVSGNWFYSPEYVRRKTFGSLQRIILLIWSFSVPSTARSEDIISVVRDAVSAPFMYATGTITKVSSCLMVECCSLKSKCYCLPFLNYFLGGSRHLSFIVQLCNLVFYINLSAYFQSKCFNVCQ
jgi:hypothetical protein